MRGHGGFEHNLQSLRVVDLLETRYAAFDGLNLMFETREGILKHCSRTNARKLGEVGERFLKRRQPSLEAQIANLADEIAYNNHDIDDGLRSGLLTMEQLRAIRAFAGPWQEVRDKFPGLAERRLIHETVRRMIGAVITDLIRTSADRIRGASPKSIEDVRDAGPLIAFSDGMAAEQRELKQFLRRELYQHFQVARMAKLSVAAVYNCERFDRGGRMRTLLRLAKALRCKVRIPDLAAAAKDRPPRWVWILNIIRS
jgi:dGTPase